MDQIPSQPLTTDFRRSAPLLNNAPNKADPLALSLTDISAGRERDR